SNTASKSEKGMESGTQESKREKERKVESQKKNSWLPGFQIRLSFDHRFSDSIVDLSRST
ncbi:MAG TPA: hypothetical protein VIM09_01025, partial [Chthoniobacterales bacterium]